MKISELLLLTSALLANISSLISERSNSLLLLFCFLWYWFLGSLDLKLTVFIFGRVKMKLGHIPEMMISFSILDYSVLHRLRFHPLLFD